MPGIVVLMRRAHCMSRLSLVAVLTKPFAFWAVSDVSGFQFKPCLAIDIIALIVKPNATFPLLPVTSPLYSLYSAKR